MSCALTLGRTEPCKDQVGGIDRVYFVNFDSDTAGLGYGTALLTFGSGSYLAGDAITAVAGTPSIYEYEIKGASSFTQNIVADRATGTSYFEQVLELTLKKLSAADHKELRLLVAARPQVIVKDNNGNFFLAGYEHGMDVTGGTVVTGTEFGDLTGYTLTLTGMERMMAPFITSGLTGFTVV